MRYLLDTNICIDLLRAGSRTMLARLCRHDIDDIGISSITFAELKYGAAKSARREHHEKLLVQFCAPLAIVSFDVVAAERSSRVRAALEQAGTPIGPLDTLIASHAMALDATLVMSNVREFRRVKGLRIENWNEGR